MAKVIERDKFGVEKKFPDLESKIALFQVDPEKTFPDVTNSFVYLFLTHCLLFLFPFDFLNSGSDRSLSIAAGS